MSFVSLGYRLRLLLVPLVLVLFVSCSADNPAVPKQPVDDPPTFENIWPAVEGGHWTFAISSSPVIQNEEIWSTPDDVPAGPAMDTLYAALEGTDATVPEDAEPGSFHLKFVEDLSQDTDTSVWRMDNRIDSPGEQIYPPSPLWLGQAWTRSATRISYSVAGFLGWLHLDGSLSVGHEFSTPIPAIVPTQLNGRVWRLVECSSLGTTYTKCIECFYVIDEGVQPVRNANNEIQGYYRHYSYGLIVYAPHLGPVSAHEMIMRSPGQWDNRVALLEAFAVETQ